ncbi:hypothetical protein [uncultured Methanoregula sp.]|uniref:hypothetical protein n=1 Tax=uncultured Methanoregula sp. TaxID=1005933 RepID=UPI002AAB0EC1|nr:hypothetical protein [uncultured Methanoregula sp.]
MADDSGMLSIDFLAGFTIFMVAFIWVATMVPGLFIGLKSNAIDYDAVAYRTGVILVEDPGNPVGPPQDSVPWEFLADSNKVDIKRFGLAVSKDTPGILDTYKVHRFFCATVFSYPDDYRTRVIFGDYPYQFNISLRTAEDDRVMFIGDTVPEGYGNIRRDVKIKYPSNATIDTRMIQSFGYHNAENVSFHQFLMQINGTKLTREEITDPKYQINPQKDQIIINITGLDTQPVRPTGPGVILANANLTSIRFHKSYAGDSELQDLAVNDLDTYLYVDGVPVATHPFPEPRPDVRENISMVFGPSFFQYAAPTDTITVSLTFGLDSPQQYLNSTLTRPFDYNYYPANVTQPVLRDAVVEVAVW